MAQANVSQVFRKKDPTLLQFFSSWKRGVVFLLFFSLSCSAILCFFQTASIVFPSQVCVVIDTTPDSLDPNDRSEYVERIARMLLPYPTGLSSLTYGSVYPIVSPTVDVFYLQLVAGEDMSSEKMDTQGNKIISDETDKTLYIVLSKKNAPQSIPATILKKYIWCVAELSSEFMPRISKSTYSFLEGASLEDAFEAIREIIREGSKNEYGAISNAHSQYGSQSLAALIAIFALFCLVMWVGERKIGQKYRLWIVFISIFQSLAYQSTPLISQDTLSEEYLQKVHREFEKAKWLIDNGPEGDVRAYTLIEQTLPFLPQGKGRQRALLSLSYLSTLANNSKKGLEQLTQALSMNSALDLEELMYAIRVIQEIDQRKNLLSDDEQKTLLEISKTLFSQQYRKGKEKNVSENARLAATVLYELIQCQKSIVSFQGDYIWPFLWLSTEADLLRVSDGGNIPIKNIAESLKAQFFTKYLLEIHPVVQRRCQRLGFSSLLKRFHELYELSTREECNLENIYEAFVIGLISQKIPENKTYDLTEESQVFSLGFETVISTIFEEFIRIFRMSELFPVMKKVRQEKITILQKIAKSVFQDRLHQLKASNLHNQEQNFSTYDVLDRLSQRRTLDSSFTSLFQAYLSLFTCKIYTSMMSLPNGKTNEFFPSWKYEGYQEIMSSLVVLEVMAQEFHVSISEKLATIQELQEIFPSLFESRFNDEQYSSYVELMVPCFLNWLSYSPLDALSWLDVAIASQPETVEKVASKVFSSLCLQIRSEGGGLFGEKKYQPKLQALFLEDPILSLALARSSLGLQSLHQSESVPVAQEKEDVLFARSLQAVALGQFLHVTRDRKDSLEGLKLSFELEKIFVQEFQTPLIKGWEKIGYFPDHKGDGMVIINRLNNLIEDIQSRLERGKPPSVQDIQEIGSLAKTIEDTFSPPESRKEQPQSSSTNISSSPIQDVKIDMEQAIQLYRTIDARDRALMGK